MGEVHEPVRREREPFRPEHLPERTVILLARVAIDRVALLVDAGESAIRRVGEQDARLLERLADDADPVTQRRVGCGPETERARGPGRVDPAAPPGGVGRTVADLDLASREHEVAGGEFARAMTPDQENLEPVRAAITKQDERRCRDRRHRRRFDGHAVVCHDDAAAVIHFVEDGCP